MDKEPVVEVGDVKPLIEAIMANIKFTDDCSEDYRNGFMAFGQALLNAIEE